MCSRRFDFSRWRLQHGPLSASVVRRLHARLQVFCVGLSQCPVCMAASPASGSCGKRDTWAVRLACLPFPERFDTASMPKTQHAHNSLRHAPDAVTAAILHAVSFTPSGRPQI